MVRRATRAAEENAAERTEVTDREVIRIRRTLEELVDARCPVCRMVLVARLGRAARAFSAAARRASRWRLSALATMSVATGFSPRALSRKRLFGFHRERQCDGRPARGRGGNELVVPVWEPVSK